MIVSTPLRTPPSCRKRKALTEDSLSQFRGDAAYRLCRNSPSLYPCSSLLPQAQCLPGETGMSTAQVPSERLVLSGVSWRTYQRLLKAFEERPAIRLTYDRGNLEIMTLSHEHESFARFLGRLAVTLTEELNLPIKEGGSTTFRRRRKAD